MNLKTDPTKKDIELKSLNLCAKIDYVTVHTQSKVKLPPLDGKPIWPGKFNGTRLTVHDATAADIAALVGTLGPALLIELEVAIDIRPVNGTPPEQCDAILKAVMVDIFAKGLDPSGGGGMVSGFRAFYRRLDNGYIVRPFNLRLPRGSDQLLHGGRDDPAQVKGYWKQRDQGKLLPPSRQCARIEVRLGGLGLLGHDLITLIDLSDFRFRKKLMPYFWHIRGTARRKATSAKSRTGMMDVLNAKIDEYDQTEFNKTGVGAFKQGGKRANSSARLLRDTPINNRLGQALLRLERTFREKKFVRADEYESSENPYAARAYVNLEQSAMTN